MGTAAIHLQWLTPCWECGTSVNDNWIKAENRDFFFLGSTFLKVVDCALDESLKCMGYWFEVSDLDQILALKNLFHSVTHQIYIKYLSI